MYRRVKSGHWRRCAPAVYFADDRPFTDAARIRSTVWGYGDHASASGLTAAWWHGLTRFAPDIVAIREMEPRKKKKIKIPSGRRSERLSQRRSRDPAPRRRSEAPEKGSSGVFYPQGHNRPGARPLSAEAAARQFADVLPEHCQAAVYWSCHADAAIALGTATANASSDGTARPPRVSRAPPKPSACGFPDVHRRPARDAAHRRQRNVHVFYDGQVFSNRDVRGSIVVTGDNRPIERLRATGRSQVPLIYTRGARSPC